MHYTEIVFDFDNEKIKLMFLMFAILLPKILKVGTRSNEYPQFMFWVKRIRKIVYVCIPKFYYTKVGF